MSDAIASTPLNDVIVWVAIGVGVIIIWGLVATVSQRIGDLFLERRREREEGRRRQKAADRLMRIIPITTWPLDAIPEGMVLVHNRVFPVALLDPPEPERGCDLPRRPRQLTFVDAVAPTLVGAV